MTQKLALAIVLLSVLATKTQAQTLDETTDWISGKISKGCFDNTVSHSTMSASVSNGFIIISSLSRGRNDYNTYTYKIPFSKISSLNADWSVDNFRDFKIYTQGKDIESSCSGQNCPTSSSSFNSYIDLYVSPMFEEDIINRLKTAFNHLIAFNKKSLQKETF